MAAPLGNAARTSSATVGPSKAYPTGRFPMPDVKHARLALQMLPRAKNMSPDNKAAVRARAQKMLGGVRSAAAAKSTQGG